MALGKIVLFGLLAGGVALFAGGTAHAESGAAGGGDAPPPPGGGAVPHPAGFDINAPPADVLKLILTAANSANPALMRSTADHLDELGYKPQAAALRAAADAIDRATKALPPADAPPGTKVVIPTPGGGSIELPPMVIPGTAPSGADPVAASVTAQLNLTDPIANGRTPDNVQSALVSKLQAQEKALGKYSGAIDGEYGPGTAKLVASYDIVPYPPFIWSANKSTTANWKASFKKAMQAKAATDPTRADEWLKVAQIAQNT